MRTANEMGITNEVLPQELAFGVSAEKMFFCDPIPDPEDFSRSGHRLERRRQLRGVHAVSWLRHPAVASLSWNRWAKACSERSVVPAATCRGCAPGRPRTPFSTVGPWPLFSDLLLHDIGTGDGIGQGDAAPKEIRTPALWGLRFRRILLHDGSAGSIEAAIRRHAQEAAPRPWTSFRQLDEGRRQALLQFLRSL